MNAQIDSFQTWPDLRPATWPESQRLKSAVGSFKIDLRAATRRVGSTKPVVSCWRNAHFHKTAPSADRLVAFSGGRLGFKNDDPAWDCRILSPPPRTPQVDLTAQSRCQVRPSGQGDQTVRSTDCFCEKSVSLQRNDRFL